MQPSTGGIVGLFTGLIGLALWAFVFALWLWMLIDCIRNETDSTQRVLWALIIFFLPCIGSLIYLVIRKLPRK